MCKDSSGVHDFIPTEEVLRSDLRLAASAVTEVNRADGSNGHEHEDGSKQGDDNQSSLPFLSNGRSNSIAKL
jgi:hypothetical protein